ncbi:uncharacterized protein LOC126776174 [Nymphalis io]|uniref:uncharacterized protein LOC126776174 n=1 Tax=Inachis io TaxID=171585 RepID=UPI0021691F93|nr:uncharacterized protein LOC126776174 [Nymphalis io]
MLDDIINDKKSTDDKLTQLLTAHGCFSKYEIARREVSPFCHEGGAPFDTAHHTLKECAAWGPQRHSLAAVICGYLSFLSIIDAMVGSEECWSEMVSFCESVMSQKGATEREREENAAVELLRRRRPGKIKRRYAHLLPATL